MALSVGFIGVGNMGNPMAGNILKAGFPMAVFDLNPKAMANLVEAGARRADSALAALEGADVVLTSLPASPDVEAMYLDAGGLVERAKPGTILIDLSQRPALDAPEDRAEGEGAGRPLPGGPGERRRDAGPAPRPWPSWWAATRPRSPGRSRC